MPALMTVEMAPLFDAVRLRLAGTSRITSLAGGDTRVVVEGQQSADDPVAEGGFWARVVIVPVVRIAEPLQLATWRRVSFLVRTETGALPDPNFRPAIVLEALQREVRTALAWFEPRGLKSVTVTFPLHPTREPEPHPRYDEPTSSWYLSSEWTCEVDSRPMALPTGATASDWGLLVSPTDQDPDDPQIVKAWRGPDGFCGTVRSIDTQDAVLDPIAREWWMGGDARYIDYGHDVDATLLDPSGFTLIAAVDLDPVATKAGSHLYQHIYTAGWVSWFQGFSGWTFGLSSHLAPSTAPNAVIMAQSVQFGGTPPTFGTGGSQATFYPGLTPGRHVMLFAHDPTRPLFDTGLAGYDGAFYPNANPGNGLGTESPVKLLTSLKVGGVAHRGPRAIGWHGIKRGQVTAAEFATITDWLRTAHGWT